MVLNLSGLERIRRDAIITRDSLLTDEERDQAEAAEAPVPVPNPAPVPDPVPDLPLDNIQILILQELLAGRDTDGILRDHHLMPDMTADLINEAMFDEIGDSIIECDNGTLSLREDYREDLIRLLGGNHT